MAIFYLDAKKQYKELLAQMVLDAQDGNLVVIMLLYSSVGRRLAKAVGVPHRWVLDMILEDE